MYVSIALVLLLLALLLGFSAVRLRRQTGLPWAPVLFNDAGGQTLEEPLYSRKIGLTGKPDYVIERRGQLIPVEVKPTRRSSRPYESDLMQLAAYCVLVEEANGSAPPYGLLRYAEQTFRLDYTPDVRESVLLVIEDMRATLDDEDCDRSHDEAFRCRACGFYEQCDAALESESD